MGPLETAIDELRRVLAADPTAPRWRWHVRGSLSAVKEALGRPEAPSEAAEAWLSCRRGSSERRSTQLQARVSALGAGVLARLDADRVLSEARRLLVDLEHHVQHQHDLVYDSVALELGGSD